MTIIRPGWVVDSGEPLRRAPLVDQAEREFSQVVSATLRRFFRQNGRAAPADTELAGLGARLWALVAERGLPRPLGPEEVGAPGGMADDACGTLVARALGSLDDPLWANAAKQLVKACFYPEFRVCRDSWREAATNGTCRRQELGPVRGRISGTHCVDCPHWVALEPVAHSRMLADEWKSGADEFRAHQAEFLPEDFRALRRWLHARARGAG